MHNNRLCRIAVFYDGTYFNKVSNYYLYQHERRARVSFKGLHDFIVSEVAKHEGVDQRFCQIIDASYFRGRLSAQHALEQDRLFSERLLEDVLMRANITLQQRPLKQRPDGGFEEKGIDVWLALEAYELASMKKYDVCVLVTGDGDFVPLINKLNTIGSRVMLLGWDFSYERDGKEYRTQVAAALIDRANYSIMMNKEIEARERRKDALIDGLFMDKTFSPPPPVNNPPPINQPVDDSRQGTILSFSLEKGYGFIRPDGYGDNCFFHKSGILGIYPEQLENGMKVSYIIAQTDKGPAASNIRPVTAP